MAIAMVALLAFGGTYAYFTATATGGESGNVTTATVSLTNSSTISATKTTNLLPGDEIFAETDVVLVNASTVKTYVFARVTTSGTDLFFRGGSEGAYTYTDSIFDLTLPEDAASATEGWMKHTEEGVYYMIVEAAVEETTGDENNLPEFTFSLSLSENVQANMENGTTQTTNVYTSAGVMADVMGQTLVSVKLEFAAVQFDDMTNESDAYTKAFKPVANR